MDKKSNEELKQRLQEVFSGIKMVSLEDIMNELKERNSNNEESKIKPKNK